MSDDGMDLELQGAVVAILKADATLKALIGDPVRLYQWVPDDVTLPYVTVGESQVNDDSVEFLDAAEIFFDLHVWSDAPSKDYVECKRICSALRRAIHNANITLNENRCVSIAHRITRTFVDADGITKHGVVTFRAETEENLTESIATIISIPSGGLGVT